MITQSGEDNQPLFVRVRYAARETVFGEDPIRDSTLRKGASWCAVLAPYTVRAL